MIETDHASATSIPNIKPRGKSGPKLNESSRRAIISAYSSGLTQDQVAEQFGVSRNTVGYLVKSIRDVPNHSLSKAQPQAWRESVIAKSQVAIDAGLDHDADPYKRATLATVVMKGVGEWTGDGQVSVFVTHVSQLPADMRSEYVSSDDALEIEATPIGLPDHNQ